MSLDSLLGKTDLPSPGPAPTSSNVNVQDARRRARARASAGGRRSTLLGGRSGGGESVARKTLLGE